MPTTERRSLTPLLPTYKEARPFLRILGGQPYDLYRRTHDALWSQRGTPQEPMDWTDPDAWMPQRLRGDVRTRHGLRILVGGLALADILDVT